MHLCHRSRHYWSIVLEPIIAGHGAPATVATPENHCPDNWELPVAVVGSVASEELYEAREIGLTMRRNHKPIRPRFLESDKAS